MTRDPRVLGVVVADPARTRRTSGPEMTLRGRALVDHARSALDVVARTVLVGEGGIDADTSLSRLCAGAEVVVVHDPLCPLVPPQVLARSVALVVPGVAAVGIRPVTDTVKRVEAGALRSTLDRDGLAELASPVAFAAAEVPAVTRALPAAGALADLLALVAALGQTCRLLPVEVPAVGRRIDHLDDLALLDAQAAAPLGRS